MLRRNLYLDVLLRLGTLRHFRAEWHAAVDCATKALRVAEDAGDLDATASALTALGMYETLLGVGDPAGHYRRAIELEAQAAAHAASPPTFSDPYWAPQTMLSHYRFGFDVARQAPRELRDIRNRSDVPRPGSVAISP